MREQAFESSDQKAADNYAKHGATFELATRVFKDPFALEWLDDRGDYGEEPYNIIGMVDGRNSTLYVGVISDLVGRISTHKQGLIEGFSRRYGVGRFVHFEFLATMDQAFRREKRLKKWPRAKKLELINRHKPLSRDLFSEISGLVDSAALRGAPTWRSK